MYVGKVKKKKRRRGKIAKKRHKLGYQLCFGVRETIEKKRARKQGVNRWYSYAPSRKRKIERKKKKNMMRKPNTTLQVETMSPTLGLTISHDRQ